MIDCMPVSLVLCYVFQHGDHGQRQVLLGHKKRGFGTGKIMGLGGHVEPGEPGAAAAIRETQEEAGITVAPDSVTRRAELAFVYPTQPELNAHVTVFFGGQWSGQVQDTQEITPQWFDVDSLPLSQMVDDEAYWLPRVLAGETLAGTITYDGSGALVTQAELHPAHGLTGASGAGPG
jgi:8-oxo-dGTP diphosphatase